MIDFVIQLYTAVATGVANFLSARAAADVLRDCLDIGIVATLIYAMLVMLKGTRAMQMAIGMGLLLLGYAAAPRQFGLLTTWQILDKLTTYVVLIIVVIFQADIRRARSRAWAAARSSAGSARPKKTQVIEEVIKAANQPETQRALIVFERGTSLAEFMEEGAALDATVSKELLYTIFIPSFENPMHDGALVIRDGRVWQAGAFLPLAGAMEPRARSGRAIALRSHRAGDRRGGGGGQRRARRRVAVLRRASIVRDLDGRSLRDALFGFVVPPGTRQPPTAAAHGAHLAGGGRRRGHGQPRGGRAARRHARGAHQHQAARRGDAAMTLSEGRAPAAVEKGNWVARATSG